MKIKSLHLFLFLLPSVSLSYNTPLGVAQFSINGALEQDINALSSVNVGNHATSSLLYSSPVIGAQFKLLDFNYSAGIEWRFPEPEKVISRYLDIHQLNAKSSETSHAINPDYTAWLNKNWGNIAIGFAWRATPLDTRLKMTSVLFNPNTIHYKTKSQFMFGPQMIAHLDYTPHISFYFLVRSLYLLDKITDHKNSDANLASSYLPLNLLIQGINLADLIGPSINISALSLQYGVIIHV